MRKSKSGLFRNEPKTITMTLSSGEKKKITIPPTPNKIRKEIIEYANKYRKAFGLKPLSYKDHLLPRSKKKHDLKMSE